MALERIDVCGPELPELVQPGVHFAEPFRLEPVDATLRVYGGLHEAGLPQHAQVLGNGRLRDAKPPFELADRLLRGGQQRQDRAAARLGDDFERGFHAG